MRYYTNDLHTVSHKEATFRECRECRANVSCPSSMGEKKELKLRQREKRVKVMYSLVDNAGVSNMSNKSVRQSAKVKVR